MTPRQRRLLDWCIVVAGIVVALIAVLVFLRRDDVMRASLDPQQPFQTWRPPPAPNYALPAAWALRPADPARWGAGDPPADVFFIHPTTYDGGRNWNAPFDQASDARQLERVMLPNYAGPFQRVGRVFAPRYRQASLFAALTNRDDAREARRFAYADVRAAFLQFLAHYNRGRPIVVVGVEQGGQLAGRLVDDLIAPNPALIQQVAGVYVIEAVVPAPRYARPDAPVPACRSRNQAHCIVAWISARSGDPEEAKRIVDRAFVWDFLGRPIPLGQREPLCVNPLFGSVSNAIADARLNLGAANASGLEWGTRPAFLPRQVSAQCDHGVLSITGPSSPSLVLAGAWADRQKVPPFNLFYADLEADAKARVAAQMGRTDFPVSAASIDQAVVVRSVGVKRAN
ncbi:MAG TPA: DUF3089 domain-containing protein [Caulobacteraceae bacterium]|jgi:hypothetical protein|nr:DUF3089 domain-containing protein [Caulobacteraceae bacterium]